MEQREKRSLGRGGRRWIVVASLVAGLAMLASGLALWWAGSAARQAQVLAQATQAALYLPSLSAQEVLAPSPPPGTSPAARTATGTTPPTATETPPPGGFEPFGVVELAPSFEVNGSGSVVDSIAFWEAPDPVDTLMLVTAKGNQRVEVWQHPFDGHELPALEHASFGTDTKVNGVVVDQARDLAYIAVSDPVSTVAVFSLPELLYLRQLVEGAVDLKGEPNLALLDEPDGGQRLYVSADDIVYVYRPGDGSQLGAFEPIQGLETMLADRFDQVLYIPDENHRTGVYAYHADGTPYLRDGTSAFGTTDVFDADAEGIALYTCPGGRAGRRRPRADRRRGPEE